MPRYQITGTRQSDEPTLQCHSMAKTIRNRLHHSVKQRVFIFIWVIAIVDAGNGDPYGNIKYLTLSENEEIDLNLLLFSLGIAYYFDYCNFLAKRNNV